MFLQCRRTSNAWKSEPKCKTQLQPSNNCPLSKFIILIKTSALSRLGFAVVSVALVNKPSKQTYQGSLYWFDYQSFTICPKTTTKCAGLPMNFCSYLSVFFVRQVFCTLVEFFRAWEFGLFFPFIYQRRALFWPLTVTSRSRVTLMLLLFFYQNSTVGMKYKARIAERRCILKCVVLAVGPKSSNGNRSEALLGSSKRTTLSLRWRRD